MKKRSGFTLIELMVVMAIIAILAIAGLAAYVGYIKKARDTARISDLGTINKAIMAEVTQNGKSPSDIDDVVAAIESVNSGVLVKDPLEGDPVCLNKTGAAGADCGYQYTQCDGGGGFAVSTSFESSTNFSRYANDGIDTVTTLGGGDTSDVDGYWTLGSCTTYCVNAAACGDEPNIIIHTLIAPSV